MADGNYLGLLGLLVFPAIAWLLSTNRKIVNLRVVAWGLGLQLAFAVFVFVVPAGREVFLVVNNFVVELMNSAAAGAQFLFGRLAAPPGSTTASGEPSLGFVLAFQAFPTIIFFAALIGILYHLRIMPTIIAGFARLFSRLMRLSGAESLCAASNIFVGVESTITVKPYLNAMTRSELCVVLTAGMATVASNVLAVYTFSLHDQFPAIAGHLVSASIMSAPAAIMMAKLIVPEDGKPVTLGIDTPPHYEREGSLFESIISSSQSGVRLIVGIAALLIAVLGIVALIDLILGGLGNLFGSMFGTELSWSMEGLLAWVAYPFTLLLGVDPSEAGAAANLIGERVVVTELVAYQDLSQAMAAGSISGRSAVIVSYALCGFAHIASLAIFIGGAAALAPDRRGDLAAVGFRALIAANLACLMTGSVAGLLADSNSILLGS